MARGPGQRHRAAIGMAEHQWPVEVERGGGSDQQVGLIEDRGGMGGVDRRIAEARPVDHGHPVAVGQATGEVEGEIAQIARGTVDQNDIGARALLQDMDRGAAHIDHPAQRGKPRLGPRLIGGGAPERDGPEHSEEGDKPQKKFHVRKSVLS